MKKLLLPTITATLFLTACGEEKKDSEDKSASEIAFSSTESTKNKEMKQKTSHNEKTTTEDKNETEKNESNDNSSEGTNNASVQEDVIYQFTQEQMTAMEKEFLDWADKRAKTAGLAVSNYYFTHGAGGFGDWFARSEDGDIQVQNLDNPGPAGFKIRAIGGVVFYTSKTGIVGQTEEVNKAITAEGYSRHSDLNEDIHKYILADNGKVYELIKPATKMSFTTGFGEYSDSGTREGAYMPNEEFLVSKDTAAQQKWQEILNKYKPNAEKISTKSEQSNTTADGKYSFINDKNEIDFSDPAFRQYYFFESHHEEAFGVRLGMTEKQVKDILGAPTGETLLSGQGAMPAKLYGDIAVTYFNNVVNTIAVHPQRKITEAEALRHFPNPTMNNLERIRNGEAKTGPEKYPFFLYDDNRGNGYQIVIDFDDAGNIKEIKNQKEVIEPI